MAGPRIQENKAPCLSRDESYPELVPSSKTTRDEPKAKAKSALATTMQSANHYRKSALKVSLGQLESKPSSRVEQVTIGAKPQKELGHAPAPHELMSASNIVNNIQDSVEKRLRFETVSNRPLKSIQELYTSSVKSGSHDTTQKTKETCSPGRNSRGTEAQQQSTVKIIHGQPARVQPALPRRAPATSPIAPPQQPTSKDIVMNGPQEQTLSSLPRTPVPPALPRRVPANLPISSPTEPSKKESTVSKPDEIEVASPDDGWETVSRSKHASKGLKNAKQSNKSGVSTTMVRSRSVHSLAKRATSLTRAFNVRNKNSKVGNQPGLASKASTTANTMINANVASTGVRGTQSVPRYTGLRPLPIVRRPAQYHPLGTVLRAIWPTSYVPPRTGGKYARQDTFAMSYGAMQAKYKYQVVWCNMPGSYVMKTWEITTKEKKFGLAANVPDALRSHHAKMGPLPPGIKNDTYYDLIEMEGGLGEVAGGAYVWFGHSIDLHECSGMKVVGRLTTESFELLRKEHFHILMEGAGLSVGMSSSGSA